MKHKHRELNETMVREAKVLISSRNKITYTLGADICIVHDSKVFFCKTQVLFL